MNEYDPKDPLAPRDDDFIEDRNAPLYEKSPVTWSELEKRMFPAHAWRINKLVPKEGFSILASISGEGKSWLGIEMAKAIVTGTDFLGNPDFNCEPGNVLYIDMEMSPAELQRRCRQLGMTTAEHQIYFANQADIDLTNISNIEEIIWLDKTIKELGITTIFIDTLRSVAGGLKEDKAEDVRQFFNEFREYKAKGVSLLWLDHCRKPNNFEGKVPKKEHLLGSQDKTASIEVLNMIKTDEATGDIGFYQRKNRLAPEIPPFTVRMEDIMNGGQTETKLSYQGEIESREVKKDQAKQVVRELLIDGPKTTKEVILILGEHHKIGSRNVRDALSELVTLKELDYSKEGRQNLYFLSANTETSTKTDSESETNEF